MPVFTSLEEFLRRVPSVQDWVGTGADPDGSWWVKFGIDIDHELAWSVIQELAHVLNCLSIDEPLPTVFKPVSPPSYLNGGPREFLSWVIECADPGFSPGLCAEWLEGRLPRPVEDPVAWQEADDEEDGED